MEKTAGHTESENKERSSHVQEEMFFAQVAERQRKLYSIAYSYLRSESDSLEAVQEATCRAWIKRKKLKNPDVFESWLIRIVINCCMDELRRRKRSFPTAEFEERAVTGEMQSHDRIDLERAFGKMKSKYRHPVMLKYYHGMTSAQIADILGKPEGTIKTWLREGLKQLKGFL
ncbi:RNA polymerase sigma factor [Saccharibacillus endophyticus]|uniref:DNA-directed RNA polymerase sigma-70 factor n=1 Tax=Saccharibacillus endophyticus TaxID=2060666 RepID=A0ABQ2A0Y0_9BACL|nr:sigma-70 family RNA polymerase sigma factor [Saccharibacillus endophyticus]GGH81900.1 DNA-directed RNA polymerase sigma-70 factor [Saccharibacillus endophyticus]